MTTQVRNDAPRLVGTNIERTGEHNQRVILQTIRSRGSIFRTELASATGLTAAAIFNITRNLLRQGLVRKGERIRNGRGQPSTRIELDPDGAYTIGLNIDRDHLTFLVLDFVGNIRFQRSVETAFASPERTVTFFRDTVDEIVHKQLIDMSKLVGIGVAIPDELGQAQLPGQPEAYRFWSKTDIRRALNVVLNTPIYVENDGAAAAIGEMQFGHGLITGTFLYVLITAGLGGGLVIEGRCFRGASGRSGEIGYLPQTLVSGERTDGHIGDAVLLHTLYERLRANGVDARQPCDLIGLTGSGAETLHIWLDEIAGQLCQPILTAGCLINPEVVYIGGRLPGPVVLKLCQLINLKLAPHRQTVTWLPFAEPAKITENAPAIGAATLPFHARFQPMQAREHDMDARVA